MRTETIWKTIFAAKFSTGNFSSWQLVVILLFIIPIYLNFTEMYNVISTGNNLIHLLVNKIFQSLGISVKIVSSVVSSKYWLFLFFYKPLWSLNLLFGDYPNFWKYKIHENCLALSSIISRIGKSWRENPENTWAIRN